MMDYVVELRICSAVRVCYPYPLYFKHPNAQNGETGVVESIKP